MAFVESFGRAKRLEISFPGLSFPHEGACGVCFAEFFVWFLTQFVALPAEICLDSTRLLG